MSNFYRSFVLLVCTIISHSKILLWQWAGLGTLSQRDPESQNATKPFKFIMFMFSWLTYWYILILLALSVFPLKKINFLYFRLSLASPKGGCENPRGFCSSDKGPAVNTKVQSPVCTVTWNFSLEVAHTRQQLCLSAPWIPSVELL